MKWDRAMTQVLTLVLITSQILMAEEVSMIDPVNETDQPVVVKINGATSERQQWIDERRLTSTVDSVPPHDIPPDRITSKPLILNDKRKERDTGDKQSNSEYLDKRIYYVDHNKSDFKKRATDYATSLDITNKKLKRIGRVAGGRETPIQSIPYLVQLLHHGTLQLCGGTLISYNHVLTAANCFVDQVLILKIFEIRDARDYQIRYGSGKIGFHGEVIQIAFFIIHPDFMDPKRPNYEKTDLAVAKLTKSIPASYSEKVPAKLPSSTKSFNIEYIEKNQIRLSVGGWGLTGIYEGKSRDMVSTMIKALDFNTCRKTYKTITRSRHLCVYEEGKDACQGDYGGGLYLDDHVWGVASWGNGCAEVGIPGLFARVDSNLDFIRKAMVATSRARNLNTKDHWGLTLIGHQVTWWIPLFAALYLLLSMQ